MTHEQSFEEFCDYYADPACAKCGGRGWLTYPDVGAEIGHVDYCTCLTEPEPVDDATEDYDREVDRALIEREKGEV